MPRWEMNIQIRFPIYLFTQWFTCTVWRVDRFFCYFCHETDQFFPLKEGELTPTIHLHISWNLPVGGLKLLSNGQYLNSWQSLYPLMNSPELPAILTNHLHWSASAAFQLSTQLYLFSKDCIYLSILFPFD